MVIAKRNRWAWMGSLTGLAMIAAMAVVFAAEPRAPGAYRSPVEVAYSPDGKLIAASDRTAKALVLIDPASGKVVRETALTGQAGGVAWSTDGSRVYVTEFEAGTVAEIDAADGKVLRRLTAGPYPMNLAIAPKKQLLFVGNTGLSNVSIIDLATGNEKAKFGVIREPSGISVTPDESLVVVGNLLPLGSAIEPQVSAAVSLLDLNAQKRVDIKLPSNTTAIRGTAVSPDGKWAYAVHTVGRTMLPATQLDRGWVNTNALSVIDLQKKELYATVLLDNLSEGAADPWGIALSKDGSVMWITIAGTHQIGKVDLAGLHSGLAGDPPKSGLLASRHTTTPSSWNDIKANPKKRADLVNDLAAMYIADLLKRIPLPGKAPRGIALSPDGKQLAVAMYFSGQVLLVDPADIKVQSTIATGPQPAIDEVRRGEIVFHDAHQTFQHWLSCASCHPNEARVDGLNWDLPNDGLGNPKNNRNLLFAHRTPPMMSMGVRDNMEAAAAAGFRFAQRVPTDEDLKAVQAYLRSLTPLRSPHLPADGGLTDSAKRGKVIFESEQAKCAHCHSGELYTSLKTYNVGTQGPLDHKEHVSFDTPTLIELWRTAPYLHDGRATTLREVLTTLNAQDKHGVTSHLSPEQIQDLVEYLLSL